MPLHWKMALITGSTWAFVLGAAHMNLLENPLTPLALITYFGCSVWLMIRSVKTGKTGGIRPYRIWWQGRLVEKRGDQWYEYKYFRWLLLPPQPNTAPISEARAQWKNALPTRVASRIVVGSNATLAQWKNALSTWLASRKIFRSKAALAAEKFEEAVAKIGETRAMCQALMVARNNDATTGDYLRSVDTALARVLKAIEEDPRKRSISSTLISDYLVPTMRCLSLYQLLLNRDLASARDVLEETEEVTLPFMAAKLSALYEQMHAHEIAQLSVVRSELELARKVELPAELEAVATGG